MRTCFFICITKDSRWQRLLKSFVSARRSGEAVAQELVEKLADPKNGALCAEVLTAVADAAQLAWLGPEVIAKAFEQKNPKIQEMALKWLAQAILDFGFV